MLNIAIFGYEFFLSPSELNKFIYTYALIPKELTSLTPIYLFKPTYLIIFSVFTSMFIHGGPLHLLGNMLYLWIFGNNVEDNLGHLRFLFFYLLCGLGAIIMHILLSYNSPLPVLGASGAIAGVLAAYLVLFPGAQIVTIIPIFFFIQIVELPAFLVIIVWFFLQLANGAAALTASPYQQGGIAWFAHIGGFLTGLLLIFLFRRKPKPRYYYY